VAYPSDGCQRCSDAITFPTAEGCQVCDDPSAGLLGDYLNCVCGECAAECADELCSGVLPQAGSACEACAASVGQVGAACELQFSDCANDI
jgi:hypothetical protein